MPVRLPDLAALVARLGERECVFIQGAAGEVPGLLDAIVASGKTLQLLGSFIPGINRVPVDRLPQGAILTDIFAHTAKPGHEGKVRQLPLGYSAFIAHVRANVRFDTAIIQVSPPDAVGRCSLGVAAELAQVAISLSQRLFGVINPQMPRLPNAASLALADFEAVAEVDAPLREYDVGAPNERSQRLARNISAFIDDGAAVQVGIGKAPDALTRQLVDRKRLRLYSGLLSDGARLLVEAGALDSGFQHTSCVHVGTRAYYQWLDGRSDFHVRGCELTHNVSQLAAIPGLVAVNSAIEVDLFGQANSEVLGGRFISGLGGAPDFARGASLSPGGISIMALPSTSDNGDSSRIVSALQGPCSVLRCDIDVVVTEHGAADLRGLPTRERAERIVGVADPSFQSELERALSAARF